jgi:molybdopterin-guanine dinucleotide biosynthesis protein A
VADRALTGILLVGGGSTRFGSPKALARLDGRTLAEHAWATLAFCDERIAVGKAADELELPFPLLDDGSELRAPIVGLVAGLQAARNELAVVLPVDTPRVDAATLRTLADHAADAAFAPTGPLPGAYRRTALPALEAAVAAGELSLWKATQRLDRVQVEIDPELLANVNTPDDLARL